MSRILLVLVLVGTASASGAVELSELRWIAANASRAECRKPPIADASGHFDGKLTYYDFRQTSEFLRTLSSMVYVFDGRFLVRAAGAVDLAYDREVVAIFTMNALAPWLRSLGYFELKRRYLEPALDNLACLDDAFGIKGLSALKGIVIFQRAALGLSIAALADADLYMTKGQAERADRWYKLVNPMLSQELTPSSLAAVRKELPALLELVKGLAVNPLLRGRVESLTTLIDFLLE